LEYEGVLTAFLETYSQSGIQGDAIATFNDAQRQALIDAGEPWLVDSLAGYYGAVIDEQSVPRYKPADPQRGLVLLVVPETLKMAAGYREKIEVWTNGRVRFTNDPNQANALLLYRVDYTLAGHYGKFNGVAAYSATAKLTIASLTGEYETDTISATKRPGDKITVMVGATTYRESSPDLAEAEGWSRFVDSLVEIAER
jgi:hypothetical protein